MNSFSGVGRLKYDAELFETETGRILSSLVEFPCGKYTTGLRVFRFLGEDESPNQEAFRAGARVVVQGRIQNRSFTSKDGIKKYSTEVNASGAFDSLDTPAESIEF
jgi:single-stranded DNA-binding protein